MTYQDMKRPASLILKTVKIASAQERWLKAHPDMNFSRWVREKLTQEMVKEELARGAKGFSALVLAAGFDRQLLPFNKSVPKALLEIRGKSIFQRQMDVLEASGVNRIGVLRGYQKAKFKFPGLYYYDNPEYSSRGILHSLAMGADFLVDSTLIVYADTLFQRSLVDRMLEAPGEILLGVDPGLPSRRRREERRVVEAVAFRPRRRTSEGLVIERVSRELPRSEQEAEFIGIALVRQEALKAFKELVLRLDSDPANTQAHLPTLFQAWIGSGRKLLGVPVRSAEWMDVDTFEDYKDAWSRFGS